MTKSFLDWLDHRIGYRGMLHSMLFEPIPGGARWRYVWGSTLIFAFSVQMITGFFLWMCYSPSSQTAWESVYYVQNEMLGGWLLRGIHHFMSQAMIVLLALHMAQVIIDGAYRAPREVNFWIGLILLQVVLGLSLTGYLLPWDQKGYWATQVATNIMGIVPVIGPYLQRIVIGGADYGHLTLTRFFAVHAGLLPLLFILLTAVHVYVFRRHGISAKRPLGGPDTTFWVDQVLKDSVACLAVLAVVLFLVFWPGAELGAPADPSVQYSAARPEWYFLFLFQLLKYFPQSSEIWGAIYYPSLILLVLFLMPLVGRWKLGHVFNVMFFFALLLAIIALTSMAILEDHGKNDYQLAVKQAKIEADRAVELASSPSGIPAQGAVTLLRNDPFIQGPRLFAQNCASCHRFGDEIGSGVQSASDLKGFASRDWLAGLLDPAKVDSPHYFGANKFKDGKMVKFVKGDFAKTDDANRDAVIAALSAEADLKSQRKLDASDAELIHKGQALIKDTAGCTDCHTYHDAAGSDEIPDLTGYGSRAWLIDFIHDPSQAHFYGKRNDRMPAFGAKQILDETQIGLIVDWLRGDWYVKGESAPVAEPAPSTTRANP